MKSTRLWTWWYHPLGTKMISFCSWVHSNQIACKNDMTTETHKTKYIVQEVTIMSWRSRMVIYLLKTRKVSFIDVVKDIIYTVFQIPESKHKAKLGNRVEKIKKWKLIYYIINKWTKNNKYHLDANKIDIISIKCTGWTYGWNSIPTLFIHGVASVYYSKETSPKNKLWEHYRVRKMTKREIWLLVAFGNHCSG